MNCPKCGKDIDSSSAKYCIFCGSEITMSEAPLSIDKKLNSPWEDMEAIGFLRAFFDTLTLVLMQPAKFFRNISPHKNLRSSIYYAIIAGSLGYMMNAVWKMFSSGFFGSASHWGEVLWGRNMLGVTIFFAPLIVLLMVYFGGLVTHLSLTIVGGNKKGLTATLRVVAYSMSAQIFAAIPVIGSVIATIWMTIVEIIGLREMHGISTFRAVMAIFLPLFVLLVGVVIVAVLLIMLGINIFQEIGKDVLPISVMVSALSKF